MTIEQFDRFLLEMQTKDVDAVIASMRKVK